MLQDILGEWVHAALKAGAAHSSCAISNPFPSGWPRNRAFHSPQPILLECATGCVAAWGMNTANMLMLSRICPKKNKLVMTPSGKGKITDVAPLRNTVYVYIEEVGIKEFPVSDIQDVVLSKYDAKQKRRKSTQTGIPKR